MALRVWAGVEPPAVGIAPHCGARMQIEAHNCIPSFLLRLGASYAMLGDTRRQALPMRTQWRRGAVDPRVFRRGLWGVLSRGCLPGGARQSAPACDIDHGTRGHLPATFGTARTAVAAGPETARRLAPLREAGRGLR
jgi:hypothetical protein